MKCFTICIYLTDQSKRVIVISLAIMPMYVYECKCNIKGFQVGINLETVWNIAYGSLNFRFRLKNHSTICSTSNIKTIQVDFFGKAFLIILHGKRIVCSPDDRDANGWTHTCIGTTKEINLILPAINEAYTHTMVLLVVICSCWCPMGRRISA